MQHGHHIYANQHVKGNVAWLLQLLAFGGATCILWVGKSHPQALVHAMQGGEGAEAPPPRSERRILSLPLSTDKPEVVAFRKLLDMAGVKYRCVSVYVCVCMCVCVCVCV